MTNEPLKIIVWTTGSLGRMATRHVLDRPDMTLVGVKAHSAEKNGRDVGDLVRRPATGVFATSDDDALLAMDADCVLFCANDSAMADPSVPGSQTYDHLQTILKILRAGKNVVCTHCPPTHYRHMRDPDYFLGAVEEACREGNSSAHWTGIDPGFITDALPIVLASLQGHVRRIETWEVLDYNLVECPIAMARLGFGRTREDVEAEKYDWVVQTWGGVPHLLADAFGITLERLEVESDFWLAPERFTCPNGYVIEQGTIGGYTFALHGIYRGRPVFSTRHVNRLRPDTGNPDWPRVGHDGGYRVHIDGRVPLKIDIPLGHPGGFGSAPIDANVTTAARLVNMAWPVVKASPGYKTVIDLGAPRGALLVDK